MWSVTLDPRRNLLTMTFAGRVGLEETRACVEAVRAQLGQLRRGFCLLTDLAKLEEMDLECRRDIDQSMDLLSRGGVKKVVRLIPEPHRDIGFGIMSLFHYGREVRLVTCQTWEEAQEHLPKERPGPAA